MCDALAQAQGWGGSPMLYKGMWDVLAKAVEKEGVKGLYKVSCSRSICSP